MINEYLYFLCMFISSMVEVVLAFYFFESFHDIRKPYDKKPLQGIICSAAAVLICVINMQNNSIINMITSLILYLVMIVAFYEGSIGNKLFHWQIFILVGMSSEMIIAFLFRVPATAEMNQIYNNDFSMLSLILATKLIQFVILSAVKQISGNGTSTLTLSVYLAFLIIPFSTLGLMLVLPYYYEENDREVSDKILLLLFYVLLVVGNVCVYYVFSGYSRMKEEKYYGEIAKARYGERLFRQNRYSKLDEQYREDMHNIKYSLRQIRSYMNDNEYEKIDELLENMKIDIRKSEIKELCGDRFLNSLVSEYIERAEKSKIAMEVFIEPGFGFGNIREIDICIMIGNLLDNAIEASEKHEKGRVMLDMYMENDGLLSICRVRNNYIGTVKEKGNRLLTSKDDRYIHGLGVRSVEKIAEKYGGFLQNEYADGIYTAMLVFSVDNKV